MMTTSRTILSTGEMTQARLVGVCVLRALHSTLAPQMLR